MSLSLNVAFTDIELFFFKSIIFGFASKKNTSVEIWKNLIFTKVLVVTLSVDLSAYFLIKACHLPRGVKLKANWLSFA